MEPGERAAPGHRQARPRRPGLHAHHLRRLRVAAAVPARRRARPALGARTAEPRQRVGLRPAHRRRQERLRADACLAGRRARPGHRRRDPGDPHRAGGRGADQGGLRARAALVRADRGPALLRPGLRGAGGRAGRPGRRGRARGGGTAVPRRAHRALRLRLRRRPLAAGRVGEPAGLGHRPDPAPGDPEAGGLDRLDHRGHPRPRRRGDARSASTRPAGTSTPRCCGAPTSRPAPW